MGPTYSAITRQPIELESCSNPLKMHEDLNFRLQKLGSFGFKFFVGNVINGVVLGFLGPCLSVPGPRQEGMFVSFP